MSGTLFVVATPIGNLEDITLRALRTLREADIIAAEDTRRTAKLLAHYAIPTPTISFHEHNTRARIPQLLARLEAGASVALVTDAGTPGISDPGSELIAACWEAGIAVDPLPGASATMTAAVASGFPLEPLTIFGFVPARSKARKEWLAQAQAISNTLVFFETPHRILSTLEEMATSFGERPIFIAREMTKHHQQFLRGTCAAIIGRLTAVKGEFTIVAGPSLAVKVPNSRPEDQLLWDEFGHITTNGGLGRRSAVSVLAKKHGCSARDVYAAIERRKKYVE